MQLFLIKFLKNWFVNVFIWIYALSLKDPDDPTRSIVKYAIRIANEPVPIWCSRRQLSLNETEAKKLRPDFPLVAIGTKAGAGDVSLGITDDHLQFKTKPKCYLHSCMCE